MDENLTQTQPSVNPQTSSTTPPVQPQKTKKPLALMIVIHLIAVAVIGYFIYQNMQLKKQISQPQSTPIASVTPTALPTTDPTANWKTYNSPENTFSFKYPSSLQLKVFDSNSLILTVNDGPNKSYHEFRVNQYSVPNGKTLYQFIYEGGVGDNYGKSYLDGNKVSLTFKDVSQGSLYKIWEPSEWPSGNGTLIKFIQNNNLLIWFSLEPYNPGGTPIPYESENVAIYNQILSTFKFTE
jgi:hypothetical protein